MRASKQWRTTGWVILACLVSVAFLARANAAGTRRAVQGAHGATKIPFDMACDGQATVAIYTRQGRMVRVLGQLLELQRGRHFIRWDGMDLWGRLVPAGTDLVVKVFTNPGLRAYYEFTIGHAGNPPWLTRPVGEGLDMRTGGWMGDHTPPISALAMGERMFFGCEVAEHGHALIVTNLEGEKLWGRNGLEGWLGPHLLTTDGAMVFGLAGKRSNHVYRIHPQTYEAKRIIDTGPDRVQAMAARDGKVYLVLRNHLASRSPFLPSVDGRSFDYLRCIPIAPKGRRPHPQQLSAQERFATVFFRGGHFQTGIRAPVEGGQAHVLAKFVKPVTIGTLVVERVPEVAKAEFYVLKPGIAYDPARHAPGAERAGALLDLSSDWTLFGKTDFPRRINFVAAKKAGLRTGALCVRLLPRGPQPKRWPPTLGMCRIMERRFTRADKHAAVILPKTASVRPEKKRPTRPNGPALAWDFRAARPITEVNPAVVILDFKGEHTFDGLCLLNSTNPMFAVDAYVGPKERDPAGAPDADWKEVVTHTARRSKRMGWHSASTHHNETYIPLTDEVRARALRLRFTHGRGSGRVGMGRSKGDPFRCDCADLALLKLMDPLPPVPSHILQVRSGESGELIRQSFDPSVNVTAMVFDGDGTLHSLADGKLCRSRIVGEKLQHTALNEKELRRPISLAVSATRIAVGDADRHAVLLFDEQGKLQTVIGDRGPRRRGSWDPNVVERPGGVAIDQQGRVWVAERLYAPKRISRFAADGRFEEEFLGPAEYGGGGFLDPSLRSFYYRSMEFALDWGNGTSGLRNLNDRLYDERSPALEGNSFVYTKIGRPIYYQGRRYVVGDPGWQGSPGVVVCLLDGPVWKPCAVMGAASGSRFLLGKGAWKKHWLAQDLSDSSFIWCDRNGDGQYQIAEVDLFKDDEVGVKKPFATAYWANWLGPDLTFWGSNARLAPSRLTSSGVPIYERKNVQPFSYERLAPIYHRAFTGGGRAKPGYGATSIVTHNGSLILEGQPYVVRPDMTIKGGNPNVKSSDYIPPILGRVMNQPLHFVGSAVTQSPVGEVAVMNGNNGHWFVVGAEDCVLLGWLFTGEEGGWGTGLEARRGTDVTRRKQSWETFFGHFIKAHNGKYYVVAGHGFHAISRIERLDDYKVQEIPLTVSREAFASNSKLRPILLAAEAAARAASKRKRSRTFQRLDRRTTKFKLDGDLLDWGGTKRMAVIGDEKEQLFFDGACDNRGLYLAYSGVSALGNNAEDVRFLFKTGFCFDMRYRTDTRNRSGGVVAGDRRIVFGRHKGRWVAVLYDYVDPSVPPEKRVQFSSPWVTTSVARVVQLPDRDCTVRFRTVSDLERQPPKGMSLWAAEVFVKWSALGLKPSRNLRVRCDFGILSADSGGIRVEKRSYWSNRGNLTVSDLGVEATLNPAAWGTVTLSP